MIPWVRGKFAERRARWLAARKQSPNIPTDQLSYSVQTNGSCSSSPKAHSLPTADIKYIVLK